MTAHPKMSNREIPTARKSTTQRFGDLNRIRSQVEPEVNHVDRIIRQPIQERPTQVAINRRIRNLRDSVYRSQEPVNTVGYGIGRGKGGIRRIAGLARRIERRRRRDQLDEIRRLLYLRNSENSIPLRPFRRYVRQLLNEIINQRELYQVSRIQMAGIEAIREGTESFFVNLFESCSLFTAHANRVTLMPKDIELAKRVNRWGLAP